MKSTRLSPSEMRKESRRLLTNIRKRIDRIEGLGSSAPQYAVNRFREIEKDVPKKLSDLSDEKLRTLYRDLRYINNLKSASVKGAKEVQQKFEPIKNNLTALSPETRKKFWEIYGKVYEITSGTMENFKYEIFETNIDYIYSGQDIDKAVSEIINEYNKSLKELGGNATDENVKLLFTSKLQTLRK